MFFGGTDENHSSVGSKYKYFILEQLKFKDYNLYKI
jgi:hypothetical protein